MNKDKLKLHVECHTCALIKLEKCKGKETRQPCLGYKSEEQYRKEVLKDIKSSLGVKTTS